MLAHALEIIYTEERIRERETGADRQTERQKDTQTHTDTHTHTHTHTHTQTDRHIQRSTNRMLAQATWCMRTSTQRRESAGSPRSVSL
jgi:uncharacterized protein